MSAVLRLIACMLALAAAASDRGKIALDIFPEKLIFLARLEQVTESPWKKTAANEESRTIEIGFRVERLLKGPGKPPEGVIRQRVVQVRRSSGRIPQLPFWSSMEPKAGQIYLLMGESAEYAEAFAQPTSGWPAASYPVLVEDVAWIAEGQELSVEKQADRTLAMLEKTSTNRSLFFGRYLAAVARSSASRARGLLLEQIAHIENQKLDEDARAELLRALHVGLVMQDKPAADEIQALLAASLQTLAAARAPEAGEALARVESVVQVYLPWLAKHVSRFPSAVLPLVAKDQRERVRETARSLATLERFSPESRDVLRQLANALR